MTSLPLSTWCEVITLSLWSTLFVHCVVDHIAMHSSVVLTAQLWETYTINA